MLNFKRSFKINKIISLLMAEAMFLNSAVYGMDLGGLRHLRVPLGPIDRERVVIPKDKNSLSGIGQGKPESLTGVYMDARKLIRNKRYGEAKDLLEKSLESVKGFPQGYTIAVRLYLFVLYNVKEYGKLCNKGEQFLKKLEGLKQQKRYKKTPVYINKDELLIRLYMLRAYKKLNLYEDAVKLGREDLKMALEAKEQDFIDESDLKEIENEINKELESIKGFVSIGDTTIKGEKHGLKPELPKDSIFRSIEEILKNNGKEIPSDQIMNFKALAEAIFKRNTKSGFETIVKDSTYFLKVSNLFLDLLANTKGKERRRLKDEFLDTIRTIKDKETLIGKLENIVDNLLSREELGSSKMRTNI